MNIRSALLSCSWAVIVALPAQAQVYALNAGQQAGQGLARPRSAGDCLIVAPLHVVRNARRITATDETGTYPVRLAREYEGMDVAILAFVQPRTSNCPNWNIPADLATRISDASVSAVLRERNEDIIISTPVWVERVEGQFITVSPRIVGSQISAGMSGAQLLVNGVFAGMVLSADRADGARERVRVLRSDLLDRLVRDAFIGPPVEGVGNRPPPRLGTASSEPDLLMSTGQSVIVGDRNTTFAVLQAFTSDLAVAVNGEAREMKPGTRIPFADSRGECFIIYLRSEDGWTRHVFAIRCNPR
ncbi:hypothetical protein [Longimicrobium terrae]|uniref:Serine protease n=1 Tax=Longimicrobium terrae TaxID=1639882 RepID=A0A841GNA3_9BACT|nr:hypothetical protein [Longimicrobium terrae]MBB4635895.1 hypothetical protein [Longimicrobium terrae]MBB6070291.1 hypothetical protein [Longimicrobium terrae]NNC30794.1 hypothetical protein [Longimicrobium terrae]